MHKIFFIIILLVFTIQGSAQDLPDWFYNPPKSGSNIFYTLGISDPGLTKEQALQQAEMRAMFVFATLHSVSLRINQVSVLSEETNQIIETFSKGVMNKNLPELYFEIANKNFTTNNEAIVLLKITFYSLSADMAKDSVKIKAISNYSTSEIGSEKKYELEYNAQIINKSSKWISSDNYSSSQKRNGNKDSLSITSSFTYVSADKNFSKINHVTDDYTYPTIVRSVVKQYNSIFPNQMECSAPMRRGIWYAYYNSLINAVGKILPLMQSRITAHTGNTYQIVMTLSNLGFLHDSLFIRFNYTDPFIADFYTYCEYDNVDKNIPVQSKFYPYRYALIIGNEDYSRFQSNLKDEVDVAFAVNDANVFREYAQFTLGIPEENITLLTNAKAIDMHRAIQKICLLIKNLNGKADIFFYYAGHGLPDEKTREAYIIPCDVTGSDLQFAIKLNDLYAKLSEYPSKRVTVFLDACFSGGARNQSLVVNRSVKIKPSEDLLTGNVVVFTASSGDQSALPYNQKGHGLFTYYLLKKFQDTRGQLSYQELSDFLSEEIGVNSVKINNKEQNSKTLTGSDVSGTWREWKFQ